MNQVFLNEFSPFPFVEKLNVSGLSNDIMDADFMAIKIGDVNGNNSINSKNKSKSRSSGIKIETVRENGSISFVSTVKDHLAGLQLSIQTDEQSDLAIIPGILNIEDQYISQNDKGVMTISWSDVSDHKVSIGDVLFSIDSNSDKLELAPDKVTEWIDSDINVSDIYLDDQNDIAIDVINISPISPNPWNNYATYTIELKESSQVDLEVLTIDGKSLHKMNQSLPRGIHSFSLSASDINNTSGLLILKVRAGEFQGVQRMTVLR